jgi:hypothetical protein
MSFSEHRWILTQRGQSPALFDNLIHSAPILRKPSLHGKCGLLHCTLVSCRTMSWRVSCVSHASCLLPPHSAKKWTSREEGRKPYQVNNICSKGQKLWLICSMVILIQITTANAASRPARGMTTCGHICEITYFVTMIVGHASSTCHRPFSRASTRRHSAQSISHPFIQDTMTNTRKP